MDDERRDRAAWLASPAGRSAIAAAVEARHAAAGDPLRASSVLRTAADLSPELAASALEQAELRETAALRHGIDGRDLLFTRDGLEAATRPMVADLRAETLVRSGASRVIDLTGGLGFDTAAFLRAGLAVTAVERDPAIAILLHHNCPRADIVQADATAPGVLQRLLADARATDVVFVDPARRDPHGARDGRTARARPERDPERWSPPWSWVAAIPHPLVMAKVAPSFAPPAGWSAEWVSVDRTVVECTLRSWPMERATRTAVVFTPDGDAITVTADTVDAPLTDGIGSWLHEIDPAVVRAGAVGVLCRTEGLAWLGPGTTWLTGDRPSMHPALRSHRVIADLPGNDRQARRLLTDLGISSAAVKSRDAAVTPHDALRAMGLREGSGAVVVITTLRDHRHRVLVEPVQSRS